MSSLRKQADGCGLNLDVVIARSEATKQSILPSERGGLLRFARNDVEFQTRLRDPAARFRASFAGYLGPLKFRGRRECRAHDAPAASHAK
jgi:hypothetical protein